MDIRRAGGITEEKPVPTITDKLASPDLPAVVGPLALRSGQRHRAVEIEHLIRRRTVGRVRDLRVYLSRGRVVLIGRSASFYGKQLAQQAVLETGGGHQITNLIDPKGGNWHLLTAAAFLSMIVPICVFLLLQRYFVRGLLAGAVKG